MTWTCNYINSEVLVLQSLIIFADELTSNSSVPYFVGSTLKIVFSLKMRVFCIVLRDDL